MKRDHIVGGFLIIDTVKDEDIGSHVMPFYVQVKKKKSVILCNWGKCASLNDTIDRIFDVNKSIRGIMLREIKCLYIPKNTDNILEFEMGDNFDYNISKMFLKFNADANTATLLAKVIESEDLIEELFIIDDLHTTILVLYNRG